jgi:hypothetical protein
VDLQAIGKEIQEEFPLNTLLTPLTHSSIIDEKHKFKILNCSFKLFNFSGI